MNDFIFVFFTISVVTGLIYFLYMIMMGSQGGKNDDAELQITSQDLLEQLKILYKQKKYNIVESLSKKYLEKKPNDDLIRVVLAHVLFDVKRFYEAIDQLKVILKHTPKNFDMQIFLANCYMEVQKPMKAIAIFQEILESDQGNVIAIKELARLLFMTNQKLSAIKMYKKLEEYIDNNPEKIAIKRIIAEIYVEFREYDNAIEEYKGCMEIYPDDVAVKKRMIELFRLSSDFDSTIEYAEDIVSTAAGEEDVLWALNVLMETYSALQNYEKAMEYANLLKENPLSDQDLLGGDIAEILLKKGQVEDCIKMLNELIESNPKNIELKKSLSKAYEEKLDFEAAVDTYKIILDEVEPRQVDQIHKEMSDLYANWAMYLFSQNDNERCFKKFAISLEYNPKNPKTYYLIGNVNQLIKNFNEAISQYKKAIELDAKNAEFYFALAQCYEAIDSIYDQKKALLEAVTYDPNNAKAYYQIAVIFSSQNDPASAISNLRKAIELDHAYVEPKHKLALILEHMGQKEEAIELYERILKLQPENQEIINNLRMLK